MFARDFIRQLAASGRYTFTTADANAAMGQTLAAVKLALNRLRRKGDIASPMRGFWVIVPPEYRRLGCLPAEQFIPSLMAHLGIPYYAALLSAAQFHGAAHHRPQSFQVMVEKPRRPIRCGKVSVTFHVHKHLASVPLQAFNTPRGSIAVSRPEATAFDLVGYEAQIGGLNAVATVMADLAETLDPSTLADLAPQIPLPWVQRLGYILSRLDDPSLADKLADYVRDKARAYIPLQSGAGEGEDVRDPTWKLLVNAELEAEG